jgi:hypothetical protein
MTFSYLNFFKLRSQNRAFRVVVTIRKIFFFLPVGIGVRELEIPSGNPFLWCSLAGNSRQNNHSSDSFLVHEHVIHCGISIPSVDSSSPVLRSQSRSRKEPHLLFVAGAGAGAGAVTRCGSGSDGYGSDGSGSDGPAPTAPAPAPTMVIYHGQEYKMTQNVRVYNKVSSYFQQYKSFRIK